MPGTAAMLNLLFATIGMLNLLQAAVLKGMGFVGRPDVGSTNTTHEHNHLR